LDVKYESKYDAQGLDVPRASDEPRPSKRGRFRTSPINRRRWQNFKANRRGYWSLWFFLVLFLVSLFAEFIANDKPLLVSFDGAYYAPVFVSYPETAFGGEFQTEADYRDPFVRELIEKKGGWMIWQPIRYSYNTINLNLPVPAPAPPSTENWLGTDDQGRDVVARAIYGFRISVLFGLTLTIFSSVVGVTAGAFQGYFGGWTDLLFQRFIEIWTSIPALYLLIIIAAVIEPNFWILLGILLLFSWVALVGVVRAEFLRGRNFEYVTAARALGLSNAKIMFKHLLPNAMVATLTFMPFILNGSISTLTSLDFLGFGLPPGSPSLGEMLAQGKANLQAPWLGLTAFFVIAIMLSLLIFVGEAVRDALDPRKTFESGLEVEIGETIAGAPGLAPVKGDAAEEAALEARPSGGRKR
jgi:microcin C transport system permease protein